MPALLTLPGLQVVIHLNAEPPAHVVVLGRGCEARFLLNPPDGPVELCENHFFTRARLTCITRLLDTHVRRLCAEWSLIHDGT